MKSTSEQKKRNALLAELANLGRRSEFLGDRLDKISLELRDIEDKRKKISRRREVIIALLDQLGVDIASIE